MEKQNNNNENTQTHNGIIENSIESNVFNGKE